jgi:hypothetical protein
MSIPARSCAQRYRGSGFVLWPIASVPQFGSSPLLAEPDITGRTGKVAIDPQATFRERASCRRQDYNFTRCDMVRLSFIPAAEATRYEYPSSDKLLLECLLRWRSLLPSKRTSRRKNCLQFISGETYIELHIGAAAGPKEGAFCVLS